jgi:NADPH:quinone reductase-like Zn-dependent oxidoreductase
MRALQLNRFGLEHLELTERPTPEPRAGEVLIRMRAAALEYLDGLVVGGQYPTDLSLPFVPGSEGAGVIEALGREVSRWRPGDRVMTHFVQRWQAGEASGYSGAVRLGLQVEGILAEYRCLPENAVVRAPKNLSDAEAAALSVVGLAAWTHLVRYARLRPGQTVLTQGTGGISLAALQIAKACGATVIATTSRSERSGQLRDLGADHVIDTRTHPAWQEQAQRLTGGRGVDVILDIGGRGTIEPSIEACAINGYIGLLGFVGGRTLSFDVVPAILKYLRLQAGSAGSQQDFERYVKAVETNDLRPILDRTYPLEQYQAAFMRLTSSARFGKVAIEL